MAPPTSGHEGSPAPTAGQRFDVLSAAVSVEVYLF